MKIDWKAFRGDKPHDPKRGIDLQKAVEAALEMIVKDQHIWQEKFPGSHAHAFVWAIKDSIAEQLTEEHGWKYIDLNAGAHAVGCYSPEEQQEAKSVRAYTDAKAKEKLEAKEIHFLDKHGFPVEYQKGRWGHKWLRRLVHTRKIKVGPYKPTLSDSDGSCDCVYSSVSPDQSCDDCKDTL